MLHAVHKGDCLFRHENTENVTSRHCLFRLEEVWQRIDPSGEMGEEEMEEEEMDGEGDEEEME